LHSSVLGHGFGACTG